MENKKIIILVGVLVCFSIVASLVSATNYYNYVYNGTTWVPMLSTSDGQKKIWLEMKNCSYGNVQENLVVAKNFSVDSLDFFVDSNMGYVGIGTNIPQNPLNVVGDVNATGDVDVGGNITLGQKITFAFGEIVDNIVDGWITITGGLSVTGNVVLGGDTNITDGNLTVDGDITFTGELHGSVVINCPSEMVRVGGQGGFCVDRYEASNSGITTAVDLNGDGDTLDGVLIYDEYICEDGTSDGIGTGDEERDCQGFFRAESVFNLTPYVDITQNHAHAACLAAEKHLCTNDEWHLAARGTPDPDATDPPHDDEACNIWTNSKPTEATWSVTNQAILTGTASRCRSDAGAYDMVGNVWEWTSDTIQDGIHPVVGGALPAADNVNSIDQYGIPLTTGASSASYNEDFFWIDSAERRAFLRGDGWDDGADAGVFSLLLWYAPFDSDPDVGFRCCK